MDRHPRRDLQDRPVDVKVVLCGLWIATLFVFAFVDVFGFWRADVIRGALEGRVPGTGFRVDQAFLVLSTVYVLVPSLMVVVSLVAPARINRWANVVVGLAWAASVVLSVVGETWAYFVLGSIVEVVLLLAVAAVAWSWPAQRAAAPGRLSPARPPGAPAAGPR